MKKILERIGIKDFKMFSVHNVRKTHGNWLVAQEVSMAKICKRLGHTAEVFLKNYASADIFRDEDTLHVWSVINNPDRTVRDGIYEKELEIEHRSYVPSAVLRSSESASQLLVAYPQAG